MATVYLGRAVGAGGFERRVAIKVMHAHVAEDPEFKSMFLDEARLAARIHHPNVVGTLDVQEDDDGMFLVMEFVEGASLRDIIRAMKKKKQRMPVGNAVRIIVDALSGLHAAHELRGKDGNLLQLVHRDVSPHNILVGADGITRITDFGVARAESRLSSTRGGQLKGKLAYMPPEQGLGEAVDRRSDVYAAGVVLWETLTGRRLFKAEHDGQLIAMVLQGTQRSPRELVPVIPESIDRACMRALSVAPENRYATAAAFADALETAAQEASVRVPTGRQLAAFVHQYKIKLKSLPPPSIEDIEMATSPSKVQSEVTASVLQTAPDPIADPPSAASVPTGTSLTGIGAVHSQRPGELGAKRNPKVMLGAAAAALVVAVLGGVALFGGSETGPAAGAGEPTVAATTEPAPPPEVPAKASVEPTTSTKTAAAPPTASAKPTESAKPAETSAPTSKKPVSGKPPKRWKPRDKRGPLGFEPDDL